MATKEGADTNENEGTQEPEGTDEDLGLEGEFDPERALSTIRKQRAEEKRLKDQLAEAREAQEELQRIKQEEADAQKTLEDKLAERDAEIKALKDQIKDREVHADFIRKATTDRGYDPEDAELAFLAAEKQGLLGKYDPKRGEVVEDHDFETLEEKYPRFQGEDVGLPAGDAARRKGSGHVKDTNSQFNQLVRGAMRR